MVVVIEVSHAPRTCTCLRACHLNSCLAPVNRGQSILYILSPINLKDFFLDRSLQLIHSFTDKLIQHPRLRIHFLPPNLITQPSQARSPPTHPNPTPNLYTNHSNPPSSSFLASSLRALTKILQRKRMSAVLTYIDDHTRTHRFPLRFPISPQTSSPNWDPGPGYKG
jgi:hypothetical protein